MKEMTGNRVRVPLRSTDQKHLQQDTKRCVCWDKGGMIHPYLPSRHTIWKQRPVTVAINIESTLFRRYVLAGWSFNALHGK